MKVLVVSFFSEWITHFGTELELAQIHLDGGDTVEFLGCDGCIEACQTNPDASRRACDNCRLRRSRGIQRLEPQVVQHRLGDYLPTNAGAVEGPILPTITDADSAKLFRHSGHDLGWGALSSTIMVLRDPVCDSPRAIELLKRFGRTALRSYLAVKAFLQSHVDFDRVYIFNGRFACTRGAFRACQEHGGIEIIIHERGSSIHKYSLYGNSMPHSRELWCNRIRDAWNAAGPPAEREAAARAFYEDRRNGRPQGWKSFVSQQEGSLLPAGWESSRRNVVIFNSSEDEFAGIGDEWKNPIYPTQSEGIGRVVTDALVRCPEAHFYLRMHPNLSGVVNSDVEMLHAIKSPNFTLIEATSSISTYALVDAAERVLTFGSTVGIEATFWGKISILAGHTFYEHLDAAYVARDHDHVMELLEAPLTPKSDLNTLKYGFYMQTFGTPFRYWQPNGFEDGQFRGRSLRWEASSELERRVRFRCLDYGIRSIFLQDAIYTCFKVAVRVWCWCKQRVRIIFARENQR